jgi:hypothetical protein
MRKYEYESHIVWMGGPTPYPNILDENNNLKKRLENGDRMSTTSFVSYLNLADGDGLEYLERSMVLAKRSEVAIQPEHAFEVLFRRAVHAKRLVKEET